MNGNNSGTQTDQPTNHYGNFNKNSHQKIYSRHLVFIRNTTATATAAATNDDGCHRCITVNLKVQTETETRQNQASKQATAPSSRGNKVYDEQQRLGQTKQ